MVELADDKSFQTQQNGEMGWSVVSEDEILEDDMNGADEDKEDRQHMASRVFGGALRLLQLALSGFIAGVQLAWSGITAVVNLAMKVLVVYVVLSQLTNSETLQDPDSAVSPTQHLQTFVVSKQADVVKEISSIEDIKTATFESYAATTCLEGVTLEKTRAALTIGLNTIPNPIRDDLVARALVDGISSRTSWMNSVADLENSAHAHSYMAFYATSYEPQDNGKDIYKTCVSVSGVKFTMAQIIVDYEFIEEEYAAGTKIDCHGFLWGDCYRVARYATRKIKKPIFDRSKLSLKEQKELQRWMVAEAISSAEHLVGGETLPSTDTQQLLGSNEDHNSAWGFVQPKYVDDEL